MSAASLGLRLLQPEAHVHIAVQRYCGGKVLADLLLLLCTLIELAKAEVAGGDEGAHAARPGERQRLARVSLAALGIEPVGGGRDGAVQVQGMRREDAMLQGGFDRAVGQTPRLVEQPELRGAATP